MHIYTHTYIHICISIYSYHISYIDNFISSQQTDNIPFFIFDTHISKAVSLTEWKKHINIQNKKVYDTYMNIYIHTYIYIYTYYIDLDAD